MILCAAGQRRLLRPKEIPMTATWSEPVITELCLGMEVTSYESAELDGEI
jgi:coenzyme PQQ precursor peptide PqqA